MLLICFRVDEHCVRFSVNGENHGPPGLVHMVKDSPRVPLELTHWANVFSQTYCHGRLNSVICSCLKCSTGCGAIQCPHRDGSVLMCVARRTALNQFILQLLLIGVFHVSESNFDAITVPASDRLLRKLLILLSKPLLNMYEFENIYRIDSLKGVS